MDAIRSLRAALVDASGSPSRLRMSRGQWLALILVVLLAVMSAVWTYSSSAARAREGAFIVSASSFVSELASVQRDSFSVSFAISEATSGQASSPQDVAVARAVLQQRLDALPPASQVGDVSVSLLTPSYVDALSQLDLLLDEVSSGSVVDSSPVFSRQLRAANANFVSATSSLGPVFEAQVLQASAEVADARAFAERMQAGMFLLTLLSASGFVVWFVASTRRQFRRTELALHEESRLLAQESRSRRQVDAVSGLVNVWVRVFGPDQTVTFGVSPQDDLSVDHLLLPSSGKFADLSRAVAPTDRAEFTEAFNLVLSRRSPVSRCTVRMAGPSGLRTVDVTFRDLRGVRDVDGVVLLVQDVSESVAELGQMQATSQVGQLLVSSSSHGVLLQDPQGGFVKANQALVSLLSLPVDADDLVAMPALQAEQVIAACSADPVAFARRVADIVAAETAVSGELLELGPTGDVLVERDFTPVVDSQGRVRLWLWTFRDVTETMSLVRAAQQSQDGVLMSSQFVTAAGHEMRTPLSVISGYAQLIADSDVDVSTLEAAKAIVQAANSIATLVDDVLMVLNLPAADSAEDVQQVVPLLTQAVADAKQVDAGLRVAVSLDDSVGEWVLDPSRFVRAVTALILHVSAGAGSAQVSLHAAADSDLRVEVQATRGSRAVDAALRGVSSLGLGERLAEQMLAPEQGVVTVEQTREIVRARVRVPHGR